MPHHDKKHWLRRYDWDAVAGIVAAAAGLILHLLHVVQPDILLAITLVLVALLLLRQLRREERDERVEDLAARTEQMIVRLHDRLKAPEVVLVGPRHLRAASEAFARQARGDMTWFNVCLMRFRPQELFDCLLKPAVENPRVTRIEFVLDEGERSNWRDHIVPKLSVCLGHEKVVEPRWCTLHESVSFVLADRDGDGQAEAQLSFLGRAIHGSRDGTRHPTVHLPRPCAFRPGAPPGRNRAHLPHGVVAEPLANGKPLCWLTVKMSAAEPSRDALVQTPSRARRDRSLFQHLVQADNPRKAELSLRSDLQRRPQGVLSGRVAQHDQQHPRRFERVNCMRDVRAHADNRPWHRGGGRPSNSQSKRAFEDEHEGIEGRRVLAEFLARIEREQCHGAARSASQDAAGNALFGRCDERVKLESLCVGDDRVTGHGMISWRAVTHRPSGSACSGDTLKDNRPSCADCHASSLILERIL